ncbi:N-acetylmannosamine-6-phosphate 2-epimerase [Paludicola sp. MB14-C6]|uniref:N-acetylmannosamine-6-phosphate 2-epimerase n=1 Tax=Paludihabitans sp. MB14-C6 TaxID=3070656 RepID=UPI0035A28582
METLEKIKSGLVVSCQALEEEPLHSSFIMGRMAYAASLGGAAGIRANSVSDITEMKKIVDLPIIGIVKQDYDDSPVRITPTAKEVESLIAIGVDIIATDATLRTRTGGASLEEFFVPLRKKYPNQIFMADCATFEECENAKRLGFDIVSTTLRGYTENTKGFAIPDYDLLKKLVKELDMPVIAEGGIWSPEQLKQAMDCGVWCAVVGTAITRPMDITKRYVAAIK